MRKESILGLVSVTLALFALLLGGCGGGGGGGAALPPGAVQMSPITTASPDGNIQAQIGGVTINSPPVVTFALSDETGQPLDPNALVAAGGRVSFTLAQLSDDGENYQNYLGNSSGQPTFDSGGTFATVSPGVYTYTFKTDIKDSTKTLKGLVFSSAKTHTVAAQIERSIIRNAKTFRQVSNPYFSFRPDGVKVTVTREVVATSACKECHGQLANHGGGRREVALCILCHNPGVTDPDTGFSIDFKSLIHKIHMGKNLPSFKLGKASFAIIGFGNAFNSYSTVTYPLMSGDSLINNSPVNCTKCHKKGTDTFGKAYGQDVGKYAIATMNGCTTCHDMTTFDGTTNLTLNTAVAPAPGTTGPFKPYSTHITNAIPHSNGVPLPNSKCTDCHDQTGTDYDGTSIPGAHTIFEGSSKFPGLNFRVNSVNLQLQTVDGIPYVQPIVNFTVVDDSGRPVNPLTFATANGPVAAFNLKLGFMINGNYVNAGINDGTTATVGGVASQPWPKVAQPVTMALNSANSTNALNPAQNGQAPVLQPDGTWTVVYATRSALTFATLLRLDAVTNAQQYGSVVGVIGMEGTYSYYFSPPLSPHHALPPGSTGTPATSTTIRAGGRSSQYYFDLSSATTNALQALGAGQTYTPARLIGSRRTSVDQTKCENCHVRLNLHGGNRTDVMECVICHNPSVTDLGNRTPTSFPWPDNNTEQTFDLKVMVHRIHIGTEETSLVNPYYFGSKNTNFALDRVPGDMRRCGTCHIQDNPFDNDAFTGNALDLFNGSRLITPKTGTGAYDPVSFNILIVPGVSGSRLTPFSALCTSCHNGFFLTNAAVGPVVLDPNQHVGQNVNLSANTTPSDFCSSCHNAGTSAVEHQLPR